MAAQQRCWSKKKFRLPFFDPGCPAPPYVKGTRWIFQEHKPPPPFGNGYKTLHRRGPEILAQMRHEQLPQSAYCLLNPPPGPEPDDSTPTIEMEVLEELRVQTAQGPQVVACRVVDEAARTDKVLVAKFFDPLYYCHNGEFDIIEQADMEYCREAAAYRHLQREGVDGRFLPAYIGSYSVQLPLSEEQKAIRRQYWNRGYGSGNGARLADTDVEKEEASVRRVRLVVTDKVEGLPMTFHLVFGDVNQMAPETRLGAVASAMEAYAQLYFYGLVHSDLAPRNIFLENTDGDDNSTVHKNSLCFHRFVDLGVAYILGGPNSAFARQPNSEVKPRSPIRLFWPVFKSGVATMYYWLPPDMRNTRAMHLWMIDRWYGDTRFEPLGIVPVASSDDTPWDTGRAQGDTEWIEEKTPVLEEGADNNRRQ